MVNVMFLQLKTNKEVLKCNQELYPINAGQKINQETIKNSLDYKSIKNDVRELKSSNLRS